MNRLYICPLTPELLPKIVSDTKQAIDVSYHTVETFPEHRYGYVTLPAAVAERTKKKLNGAIFQGSKMKVEEAKPKASPEPAKEPQAAPVAKKKKKGGKKRKREEGVLQGHQLPEDRKVRRGWTETAEEANSNASRSRKKRQRSTYSEEAELLFKTTDPKSKDAKSVVVHEFERTTKHPSFLRSSSSSGKGAGKSAVEYDDEKGWLDEDGNVVEKAAPKRLSTTSSGSEPEAAVGAERMRSLSLNAESEETSSSGSSESESEEEETEKDEKEEKEAAPPAEPHPLESLFKRPAPISRTAKTPQKPNLEVKAVPFSFFNAEEEQTDEAIKASLETPGLTPSLRFSRGVSGKLPNLSIPPHTPFTANDRQWRAQRSAAPTPDTALPTKTEFGLWNREASLEDDIEEEQEANTKEDDSDSSAEESPSNQARDGEQPEKKDGDFEKWFWENRGENNRAWKKKRREAAKDKRAKENKQRSGT